MFKKEEGRGDDIAQIGARRRNGKDKEILLLVHKGWNDGAKRRPPQSEHWGNSEF